MSGYECPPVFMTPKTAEKNHLAAFTTQAAALGVNVEPWGQSL